jgi:hypothetical protein
MKFNQKVRVVAGLERNHTATIIEVGTEEDGRANQVRIRFDKNGAQQAWADKWINVNKLEEVK